MTSNIGSQYILDLAGDDSRYEEMRSRVMEAMRASFRPEFLNRIDENHHLPCLTETGAAADCSVAGCKIGTTTEGSQDVTKLSDAALDF